MDEFLASLSKEDSLTYELSMLYKQWGYKEYRMAKFEEYSFYAEAGSYIYEIALSWEDESAGYFGSANYYVCINGGLLEG